MSTETAETHEHPTDAQYVKIALFLAILTGAEVSTYFIDSDPYSSDLKWPLLVSLIIMMVVKFGVVVAFFMHLRFDHAMFRRLFFTGLVLAVIVYFIVFFAFGFFSDSYEAAAALSP